MHVMFVAIAKALQLQIEGDIEVHDAGIVEEAAGAGLRDGRTGPARGEIDGAGVVGVLE